MADAQHDLDMSYDRQLIEDVLDSNDLRYVALYMFEIRKTLFQDLIDEDLIQSFDMLLNLEEPTIKDIQRISSNDFIRDLFKFHVITNIRNYNVFQMKSGDFKVKLAKGIRLLHQDLDEMEEEVHIFFSEVFLLRVINPDIPEITLVKIHKALERMRAMMCPKTPQVHPLVHKYGEEWVIDDYFYYVLEELGNPYQALRIELMIRQMSIKYSEIEKKLDSYLKTCDDGLATAKLLNKCRKAKEKNTINYVKYLTEKSRKTTLSSKFWVEFPENKKPSIYIKWIKIVNHLIGLRLHFDEFNKKMDSLRAYYSGKKQIMPYMKFIEETSFNDEISESVKTLLLTSRNDLKDISTACDEYNKKELKLLNLELERLIIEEGLDTQLEDEE